MTSLDVIDFNVSNFIKNGSHKETEVISHSNDIVLGVVEIFRHRELPLYVLSLKTKVSDPRARRYAIRSGIFDQFGLGRYCKTDKDIVSYQITFSKHDEAFNYCCHLASLYKDDLGLLNPRDGNFFLPTIPGKLVEILDGAIAGDGGVYRRYSSSIFTYTLGEKQLGHLEEFKNELSKFGFSGKIRKYKIIDSDSSFAYSISWTLKAFNQLRDRWYVEKQKILPKDLRNSPNFWKWFYAGDGCLYVGSPFSYRVLIAANDFLTEDVDRLLAMLSELNIKSTKYLKRYTESSGLPQWTIVINNHKEVDKFLDYIGSPVRSIEYKWIRPKKPSRICPGCNTSFTPTRGDNTFCNVSCMAKYRQSGYRQKKKQK